MTAREMLRAVAAQARLEIVLTLRRGESVLVTLVIPLALLVFFASARVLPPAGRHIGFLVTGTVTLSIISTSLVSLGIATAYERYYGVLKQLGTTPLPRAGLIAGKLLAVLALEFLQVALLVALSGVFYGWRPAGSPLVAVVVLVLGTACFAGIGLGMAGALRAEATLGAANGLFLFFLLLGGLYVPIDHLPSWLVPLAGILPAAVMVEALRSVLHPGATLSWPALGILVAWAVLAPAAATRLFRWQ
jgi:ABC-2 type transport system permease protein